MTSGKTRPWPFKYTPEEFEERTKAFYMREGYLIIDTPMQYEPGDLLSDSDGLAPGFTCLAGVRWIIAGTTTPQDYDKLCHETLGVTGARRPGHNLYRVIAAA